VLRAVHRLPLWCIASATAECRAYTVVCSDSGDCQHKHHNCSSTFSGVALLQLSLVTCLSRQQAQALVVSSEHLHLCHSITQNLQQGALREHVHRCVWQSICWLRSTLEAVAAVTPKGRDPYEVYIYIHKPPTVYTLQHTIACCIHSSNMHCTEVYKSACAC
jgi:hypothetical protein